MTEYQVVLNEKEYDKVVENFNDIYADCVDVKVKPIEFPSVLECAHERGQGIDYLDITAFTVQEYLSKCFEPLRKLLHSHTQ